MWQIRSVNFQSKGPMKLQISLFTRGEVGTAQNKQALCAPWPIKDCKTQAWCDQEFENIPRSSALELPYKKHTLDGFKVMYHKKTYVTSLSYKCMA